MLKAKKCLGNIWKRGETNEATLNQQGLMMVEVGRDTIIGHDPIERHWHKTLIEDVSDLFYEIGMQIRIDECEKQNMPMIKTVMKRAICHARITGQNNNTLKQINFVRMKKTSLSPD